jgi:uncharacterized protein (DUF1501 family)
MSITRRNFILNGLGFVSLGMTMPSVLFKASQALADAPAPRGKTLVVLEMAGGNDGLNTVIPTGAEYALYQAARPTIGLTRQQIIDIGGGLGLHPALAPLADLFKAGKMAVVTGVGYPNPIRSHFVSMDIWQMGDPQKGSARNGWIGRYLDADGHFNGKPLGGIALGSELPLALQGENITACVVSADGSAGLGSKSPDTSAQMASFREMYQSAGTTAAGSTEFIHNVGNDIYTSTDAIKDAFKHYDTAAGLKANYPIRNGLASNLQAISRMICGGLPTKVYYTITGGFDTHANQPRGQEAALSVMADSVAAFYRDLELQGHANDVTLMTFSEFGRRVHENASQGTDHGTASVMFVVGSAVRGGSFGSYPSLTNLDAGDLKFTTDFRSVYATLLDNWLGTPSQKVLGGNYAPLKFV